MIGRVRCDVERSTVPNEPIVRAEELTHVVFRFGSSRAAVLSLAELDERLRSIDLPKQGCQFDRLQSDRLCYSCIDEQQIKQRP